MGEPLDIALRVDGGAAPYGWTWSDEESFGRVGQAADGPTLELSGAYASAGAKQLTVSVQAGPTNAPCQRGSISFPIDVEPSPVIGAASLGEACVGEPFDVALVSEPAGDEWAIEGGLPEGLRLEGGRIVGTPTVEGSYGVDVNVVRGSCSPVRQRLSLTVRGADVCPIFTTRALRAPCAGLPYAERLSAVNGQPPYRWALLEGPSWLSFDPETQALSGLPEPGTSTTATFELVDAGGKLRQATYSLEPRSSCSFAYVSSGGELPGLHYADVFGAGDAVLSQGLAPDLAVADFSFSPDGRFLAFRAGSNGEQSLYVVTLPAGPVGEAETTGPVPFACSSAEAGAEPTPCSVLDYAWSPDARHLGVSLGEPGSAENFLSVVGVEALDAPWPVVGAQWRQGLAWVGPAALVFSGGRLAQPELQFPSYLRLPASGVTLTAPLAESVPATEWKLRTTPSGALFFDGVGSPIHLSLLDQPSITVHAPGWLSPSGRYAAASNAEGRLQLYAVGNATTPIAESEPGECEVVFAWAERREVIACVRSVASVTGVSATETPLIEALAFSHGSGLRIFELDPLAAVGQRLRSWAISPERYEQVATAGHRRALSADGQWLVFLGADASGAQILQRLDTSEMASGLFGAELSDVAPIELAVSPVGNAYATYAEHLSHGTWTARDYDSTTVTDVLEERFSSAERTPCAEEQHVSPERWCGLRSLPDHFTFSPDGRALLLEDAQRGAWLADISADAPILQETVGTLPECDGSCSRQPYAFRPVRQSTPGEQ